MGLALGEKEIKSVIGKTRYKRPINQKCCGMTLNQFVTVCWESFTNLRAKK